MLKYTPTVFAVGNAYQIMVSVTKPSLFLMEAGGRCFYDEQNGVMRSLCTTSKCKYTPSGNGLCTVLRKNQKQRRGYAVNDIIKRSFDMERYAWKAIVKEGKIDEYVRRHDMIWQEMKDVLNEAGIVNYTIWNVGNELFGYYECEKGIEHAARVQAQSAVVDRWNEYMKDVMIMELDPETGAQPQLKKVFSFNAD